MEERTLFGIALIFLLLGLPALWILSVTLELSEEDTLFLEDETTTKISGKVLRVTTQEDFTIAEIERTTTIPLLIFDSVELEKGMQIEAIGKVETYKGKKEILANEIRTK